MQRELKNSKNKQKQEFIIIEYLSYKECFRWLSIQTLNLINKNPSVVVKRDKTFFDKLYLKGIEFDVTGKDYHKIGAKNKISINVFIYENGCINSIFMPRNPCKNQVKLSLIRGEKNKSM